MSSPSPDSSQDLDYCYPPIRVNHSLASLDLNTLIMRSNPRRQADGGQGSLEESSYELLSKSMCESDDEGHTASVASTDGPTPDDLSSIDGFEEEDDEYYMNDASQHLPPPLEDIRTTTPPPETQEADTLDDSMMTSTADTQKNETSYLKLDEATSLSNNTAEATRVVSEFDEVSGLPSVLQGYGCPSLRFSVKMAVSERFLPEARSFRLLYVGEFPEWAKELVNKQIGATLSATPSSSRFNIVQDSVYSGSASSSKVQLERSGSELVVDHCVAPKVLAKAGKPYRVMITLDDESQLAFTPGATSKPAGAGLPDLVVFCHVVQADSILRFEDKHFYFARHVLKQHGLPSLDMVVTRPYGGESLDFDTGSLRLCVEGRPGRGHEFAMKKSLPIDMYTFLAIDPSQLNRHLANLQDRSNSTEPWDSTKERGNWTIANLISGLTKSSSRSPGELWAQRGTWVSIVALMAMIAAYIVQSALIPVTEQSAHGAAISLTTSTSTTLSTSSTMQITSTTPSAISVPSVAPVVSTPRDLTVVPTEEKSRGSWRDLSVLSKEDHEGSLEIEVTGDHQFMLRPSKQLLSGRRKPQFQVQVHRDSETVPIRVLRASDDSYTVDLQNEYPVGTFNVSVVARRKPLLQQSFEVKLGSNKSTFSSMVDSVSRLSQNVRRDIAVAQVNLRSLSTQLTKSLHEGVTRLEDGASATLGQSRQWSRRLQGSTQTVAEHLQEARNQAARQLSTGAKITRDVSRFLQGRASDVVQEVKSDLWRRSRPLMTSPSTLRARKNALLLRRRVEKRFGRHDKSLGEMIKRASAMYETAIHKQGCRKSKQKKGYGKH